MSEPAARELAASVSALVRRHSDLLLAALVVAVVAMMIVPLPTVLVDLLLSLNITLAVILLMVSIYVGDPMRIATFPTILLITTLFRLGLNVSTTRLILAQADAGEVVRSFGSFVVAGNLVVGIIVFLIITLIQFVVIARGTERVAEVAARFALDAMPGKQMSIDADVRSGAIDQAEARRRRAALERESQFYGSMDGAMKFVKGDAVAAILIAAINIVGGLIIGIGYRGMSAGDAVAIYSMLTIGEGLVAQIPALLIALAAGLIVTRVASEHEDAHLGHDIVAQVLAQPRAVAVAAALLAGLAMIPGLPTVPFLTLAGLAAVIAASLVRGERRRRAAALPGSQRDPAVIATASGEIEQEAPPVTIELGPELAGDAAQAGGDVAAWAENLAQIRRALHARLGALVPAMEVRIDGALGRGYRLRIAGVIADEAGDHIADLAAAETPVSAAAAARQLQRALERHAADLIGMEETQAALDRLARAQPAVVREVVPALIGVPRLTELLRQLVRERIAVRDLSAVLHAVARHAPASNDPAALADAVRAAMRRQITRQYAPGGALRAWRLDPLVEDTLRGSVQRSDGGAYLALEPELARDITDACKRAVAEAGEDAPRVVLAAMDVRRHVGELLAVELPDLAVLAPQELLPDTTVQTVATLGL